MGILWLSFHRISPFTYSTRAQVRKMLGWLSPRLRMWVWGGSSAGTITFMQVEHPCHLSPLFHALGEGWDHFSPVQGANSPVMDGANSPAAVPMETESAILGPLGVVQQSLWISTSPPPVVTWVKDINTASYYGKTMKSDMVLDSSLGPDITMAPGGSTWLSDQHGPMGA